MQSSALTIAPSIYQKLTYGATRDLAAVTVMGVIEEGVAKKKAA